MKPAHLSVVIPTRNRAASLQSCLEALVEQLRPEDTEVVVADDGSDDSTEDVLARFPQVKVVKLDGRGSSAARNAALGEASGAVVLFIDDDIVVTPGLVQAHLDFHQAHEADEDALVGLVTWDPRERITSHMRWLEDRGPLFAFNAIESFEDVDPAHFCTANVSLKRRLLDRVDGPFNEEIPRFTDVELAFRLAAVGMRLRYNPDAVAWHLRWDNPKSTDKRMFTVGQASVLLDELHPGSAPEAASLSTVGQIKVLVAKCLTPLCPVLPRALAERVWSARAAWAYASGRADELKRRGQSV